MSSVVLTQGNTILGKIYEWIHPGTFVHIDRECKQLNGSLLVTNVKLGIVYMGSGIIYELIYLVCMYAMLKPQFIKMACYKILFSMGIGDITSLVLNSLFTGYFLMIGGSVCTHPLMNLYGGHTAFALWCTYCAQGIILGVNRCADFLAPSLGEELFKGMRVYIWIMIPYIYGLYVFIHEWAPVFHPILAGFFFDVNPFKAITTNVLHTVNNFGVTSIVIILNVVMIYCLIKMASENSSGVTKTAKVIVLQCICINVSMVITSAIHVFMQFCNLPMIFTVITTMLWHFSNGCPGFFYITINKSMRDEVLGMLGIKKGAKSESGSSARPSRTTKDSRMSISALPIPPVPFKLPPIRNNSVVASNDAEQTVNDLPE